MHVFQSLMSVSLALLAMMAWRYSHTITCFSLILPVAAMIMIAVPSARFTIARRQCFANCFFVPGSFLHGWFQRKTVSIFIAVALAALGTFSLMLSLVTWETSILTAIAIDGLIVATIAPRLLLLGTSQLRPEMASLAARATLANTNALAIVAPLLWLQFNEPIPDFVDRENSLGRTILNATAIYSSNCAVIDQVLWLNAVKESFSWWLVNLANANLSDPNYRLAAWLAFLSSSLPSAWAFSRLIVEVSFQSQPHGGRND